MESNWKNIFLSSPLAPSTQCLTQASLPTPHAAASRGACTCALLLCLSLAPSTGGQPSRTGPFPPAAQASLHSQFKGMTPPEPCRSRSRQRFFLACEMSLSVLDWGCHGAVLRAATGGITWAIATGHLHPPLHKESHCLCCLTPPCPNLVGFGGGGGVELAVGGASMAPKRACPLNALSLRSTQGKVWVGGQVPGQQLGWSVVSAASLVEGA